jgi:Raf kinase inhibitor-like YbhB/YbcL family protein
LIVEDPDAPDPQAPKTTWVHWVLYNIPPTIPGLPEDITHHAMPAGTLDGLNDWMRTGYGGPCPPVGRHRYFHRLYALSVVLPDLHKPRRAKLLQVMHGKVLAEACTRGFLCPRLAVRERLGALPAVLDFLVPRVRSQPVEQLGSILQRLTILKEVAPRINAVNPYEKIPQVEIGRD